MKLHTPSGIQLDITWLGNGDVEVNAYFPPKTYNSYEKALDDRRARFYEAIMATKEIGVLGGGKTELKKQQAPKKGKAKSSHPVSKRIKGPDGASVTILGDATIEYFGNGSETVWGNVTAQIAKNAVYAFNSDGKRYVAGFDRTGKFTGYYWSKDMKTRYVPGQTFVQVDDTNKGNINKFTWGETQGVYPSSDNLYDPEKWDQNKLGELEKARAGIIEISKRNTKIDTNYPDLNNPIQKKMAAYHLSNNLPQADSIIKNDTDVKYFYLAKSPTEKTTSISSRYFDQEIVKSYGPFYATKGGDAPGIRYINFYKAIPKKKSTRKVVNKRRKK